MLCPECGEQNTDGAEKCLSCGEILAPQETGPKNAENDNKSEKLKGFNGGAFVFNWIWALAHRQWGWAAATLLLFALPFYVVPRLNRAGMIPSEWIGPVIFVAFFVPLIIPIYLGARGNVIGTRRRRFRDGEHFEETEKSWSSCASITVNVVIILFIAMVLGAVCIPWEGIRMSDNAKFTQCLGSMAGIKVAQMMYITDHGIYTMNKDYLGMYMIAGCTDPEGKTPNCNGVVNTRIRNNCKKDEEWEITPGVTGDNYSYYVKATASDRYQCKVCISPDGYLPTNYKSCSRKRSMECPEREIGKNIMQDLK